MPPFADSIRILVCIFIFFGSAAIIGYAVYRLVRFRRIGVRLAATASLAALPLAAMIVAGEMEGDIELNPRITSKEQLIGTYSDSDHVITLAVDGTYTASGFESLRAGTWSNYDWNLQLSHSGLRRARVITRNKVFCIAPFYAGADAPLGILLRKN